MQFCALPRHKPRWLVSYPLANTQKQVFLLYAPYSRSGRLFKRLALLSTSLGAFRLFGRRWVPGKNSEGLTDAIDPLFRGDILRELIEVWEKLFNVTNLAVAISLGTRDRFQKVTTLLMSPAGDILGLAKIGCTREANGLISSESTALKQLKRYDLVSAEIPDLLGQGSKGRIEWMLQSLLPGTSLVTADISRMAFHFLVEMAMKTSNRMVLGNLPFWEPLKRALVEKKIHNQDFDSEAGFVKHLQDTLPGEMSRREGESWPFTACHGDFAPWNMRTFKNALSIFDWEEFMAFAPAGWDMIHYVVSVEHLLRGKPFEVILKRFVGGRYDSLIDRWERKVHLTIRDWPFLVRLFLGDLACEASRLRAAGLVT